VVISGLSVSYELTNRLEVPCYTVEPDRKEIKYGKRRWQENDSNNLFLFTGVLEKSLAVVRYSIVRERRTYDEVE
jgi:hypothetical protein